MWTVATNRIIPKPIENRNRQNTEKQSETVRNRNTEISGETDRNGQKWTEISRNGQNKTD